MRTLSKNKKIKCLSSVQLEVPDSGKGEGRKEREWAEKEMDQENREEGRGGRKEKRDVKGQEEERG